VEGEDGETRDGPSGGLGGKMKERPISVELTETPQGWVARVAGMDDYESDHYPTPHQALEEVADLMRQFWEAFSVLAKGR